MKNEAKRTTTIERTYEASIEDVWELWTTKEGIESWWGPEGFSVTVLSLDLRPGGVLRYAMTATAAPQIEFMKRAGMPVSTETSITYREIDPPRRLVYVNHADFIPGVAPYDVGTVVELTPTSTGVQLRLILDVMHDDIWTERAIMGWEGELGKLGKLIDQRRGSARQ